MALKATINKALIHVSDMDRHVYDTFNLTIAQHPSETDKRMMVRLLAYVLNSREHLRFTKGLSEDSEPEIWAIDYSDQIQLWIDLGEVDEKRIKKACAQSQQVIVYTYHSTSEAWWQKMSQKVHQFDNLKVVALDDEQCEQLANFAGRSIDLTCTIDSGHIYLNNDNQALTITPTTLKD
ncbi:YaeQ family protein [Thalassotalea maritima]|uniref:YaeQ family protein n=1 Tax=Thalassotalea maritima TaxID=3242416 RepID=UPI0035284438